MTQRETVLKMLQNAGPKGVLSKTFIAQFMPRAAARIQELRDEGVEITSEREGKYVRWTLQGHHSAARKSAGLTSGQYSREESAAESHQWRSAGGPPNHPSMFDADAYWDAAA
jgi:hypothetical protein